MSEQSVLADVDGVALGRFYDCGETLQYRKQQVVIKQGARQGDLFVVMSGLLHVVHESGHVLDKLEPGDSFGEISFFDGQPASAAVVCVKAAEVFHISGRQFSDFLAQDPATGSKILFNLGKILAQRLRKGNDHVAALLREFMRV